MFLSDVAEFRRKSYEKYLQENKPELYESIQSSRKELTDSVNKQRINPQSTKKVQAVVVDKRKKNTLKLLREMGGGKENASDLRNNMSWLGDRQTRNAPMKELQSRIALPQLENIQRGLKPLPPLQPKQNPVLPDLEQIPTKWNKPSFDVVVGKHDGRTIVNPVKDTVQNMGAKKPVSKVVVPKAPKTNSKMLKNLGVVGMVGGGVLGAYGLKKYADSRQDKKKK